MSKDPMAFPFSYPAAGNSIEHNQGMTLRDWFAGQALAGMCGDATATENMAKDDIAEWCYGIADDMMKERDK